MPLDFTMGLFRHFLRRFVPPRMDDPQFGPLIYMHIPNAPERSYWEGEWVFPPTGTKVAIGLVGTSEGPREDARVFYLALPSRFAMLLDRVRPRLDDVFRGCLDRPLAADLWQDVTLSGIALEDPAASPVLWDLAFETTGKRWLGIAIPFRDDEPQEPVIET
jgi:hypothetical protein